MCIHVSMEHIYFKQNTFYIYNKNIMFIIE